MRATFSLSVSARPTPACVIGSTVVGGAVAFWAAAFTADEPSMRPAATLLPAPRRKFLRSRLPELIFISSFVVVQIVVALHPCFLFPLLQPRDTKADIGGTLFLIRLFALNRE